jgi:hypothetical protein
VQVAYAARSAGTVRVGVACRNEAVYETCGLPVKPVIDEKATYQHEFDPQPRIGDDGSSVPRQIDSSVGRSKAVV